MTAAELPAESVVANRHWVWIRPFMEADSRWRMSGSATYFPDGYIDNVLADGGEVLRVGAG